MIFKTRNRKLQDIPMDILLNDKIITQTAVTKFLGIFLDENIDWSKHIEHISFKISRAIGVLSRLRHFIPVNILINLYNTLILPHISYCTIVWGHCSQTLINKLFVLQKRAIRIITNSHPRTPSKALFMKYNILPIHDTNKLYMDMDIKGAIPDGC